MSKLVALFEALMVKRGWTLLLSPRLGRATWADLIRQYECGELQDGPTGEDPGGEDWQFKTVGKDTWVRSCTHAPDPPYQR